MVEDLLKNSNLLNLNKNKTFVMGILNLTPDSFYDGGKNLTKNNILSSLSSLSNADIIDVGAESSKPFSNPITISEELRRLEILNDIDLNDNFLSIDTYKPEVIKYAIKNGYSMINDISGGGVDNSNIILAAEYNVPIVLMHMKGNPANMQNSPRYTNVVDEIKYFFEQKINFVEKEGINKDNIILDPGLGFGKTALHNYEIILNLKDLKKIGYKILIGASRKSFLSNEDSSKDRIYPSIGIASISIINGADIVRVHDVNETIMMTNAIDKIKYLN